jgi:hypothetical protein
MKPFISVLAIAALAGVVLCCVLLLAGSAQTQFGKDRPRIDHELIKKFEYPRLPPEGAPKPSAVAIEPVYDFGLMDVMTEGKHEFIIRNVGEGNLVLKQGETTCSCTISTIQSDGVVPPGGEANVKLEWDTKAGMIEDYRQTAEILTNDADNRTIQLVVKGTIRSFLLVVPPIWTNQVINAYEPTKKRFVIASASPEPFEVTKVESSIPDFLSYEIKPVSKESLELVRTLSGFADLKNAWDVDVTVKPGMPQGRFLESLTFHTNITKLDKDGNVTTLPPHKMRFDGKITGDVTFFGEQFEDDRQVVKLGNVITSTGKTSTLFMYTHGVAEDIHPKIKSKEPEFLDVDISKEPTPGVFKIEITVPPGTPPCSYMGIADEQGRPVIGRILIETENSRPKELLLLVQFAVRQN